MSVFPPIMAGARDYISQAVFPVVAQLDAPKTQPASLVGQVCASIYPNPNPRGANEAKH